MRQIVNNYLLMTRQSDFDNSLLKNFYYRLGIFLSLDVNTPPTTVFTSNKKKIKEHYDFTSVEEYGRAFYVEGTNTVVLDATTYDKKNDNFNFKNNLENIQEYAGQYRYIIPLSDVYHELIHSVQYQFGMYEYTDIIEATDETMTYFITGDFENIDYIKSALSLWYIAKYILKIKKISYYVFIRNCICKKDFDYRYFMKNKNFIKLLAEHYNGNFKKFMHSFKMDFYNKEYMSEFKSDMNYIHNLIFYNY